MLVKHRTGTIVRSTALMFVAVVAAAVLSVGPKAYAATNSSTNVIKVTPVRTDISVKPGQSQTVKVIVTNLTSSDITVTATENDFIAGDERGTPSLILDASKYAPTHSLKRFMTPISDVTIPKNSGEAIDVLVTVPADAQPGGYFGAVRFTPNTVGDAASQVNLSSSAASLILLTVPGNAVEKLNLTDFSIQQNNKTGNFFQTPDGITATFRFENKGGLQEAPFGKITVKNGNNVVYDYDFNNTNPKNVILPDSARRWDVPLKNISKFGHYTVNATISYGKSNETFEVSKSFWVVPLSYIIGGIVGLVVLILVIVGIWWFLRRYKRNIIRDQGRGRL